MKNENENETQIGQKTTYEGRYFRTQPITYGVSLKSGRASGGHFWNIPPDCDKRVLVDPETQERWLDVNICRACARHKKGGCVAYGVQTGYKAMIASLDYFNAEKA